MLVDVKSSSSKYDRDERGPKMLPKPAPTDYRRSKSAGRQEVRVEDGSSYSSDMQVNGVVSAQKFHVMTFEAVIFSFPG